VNGQGPYPRLTVFLRNVETQNVELRAFGRVSGIAVHGHMLYVAGTAAQSGFLLRKYEPHRKVWTTLSIANLPAVANSGPMVMGAGSTLVIVANPKFASQNAIAYTVDLTTDAVTQTTQLVGTALCSSVVVDVSTIACASGLSSAVLVWPYPAGGAASSSISVTQPEGIAIIH
jgi:hypothetical protein